MEDHLTVSLSGALNLTSGVDTLCYNHTLERVFQNRPGIAICKIISNIQPFTIFSRSIVLINFSPSNLSELIVMELFPSLLELNGNILLGLKSPSLSLPKIEITSKPDIIRLILALWLDVLLERIFTFSYLSELTSRAPSRLIPTFMDSK